MSAPVDISAKARGSVIHWIRFHWHRRHGADGLPGDHAWRRRHREGAREAIEQLRKWGPGPVEPVQTGGGWMSVPETWWGPR